MKAPQFKSFSLTPAHYFPTLKSAMTKDIKYANILNVSKNVFRECTNVSTAAAAAMAATTLQGSSVFPLTATTRKGSQDIIIKRMNEERHSIYARTPSS